MYLNYISGMGNVTYIKEWFRKRFVFVEFDEDTYNRICVIAELDLGRYIVDCLRDQREGITVIYKSGGKEVEFVLQPLEIKQAAEANAQPEKAFNSIDGLILNKIKLAETAK